MKGEVEMGVGFRGGDLGDLRVGWRDFCGKFLIRIDQIFLNSNLFIEIFQNPKHNP